MGEIISDYLDGLNLITQAFIGEPFPAVIRGQCYYALTVKDSACWL